MTGNFQSPYSLMGRNSFWKLKSLFGNMVLIDPSIVSWVSFDFGCVKLLNSSTRIISHVV